MDDLKDFSDDSRTQRKNECFSFSTTYRELSAAGQDIPIQQLALESGFGSYRTFSRAFLLRTGKSVTAWMNGGA